MPNVCVPITTYHGSNECTYTIDELKATKIINTQKC